MHTVSDPQRQEGRQVTYIVTEEEEYVQNESDTQEHKSEKMRDYLSFYTQKRKPKLNVLEQGKTVLLSSYF